MDRVVVVGASLAGVHAAEALRERGFAGELVLISAEDRLPYERPPISKENLLGPVDEGLSLLRAESWYGEQGVELRLGQRALALDPRRRTLTLSDHGEIAFDGLVLATGSSARRLSPLHDLPDVHVLRTVDDAERLRAELLPGRHLVVIGGGFIALEVAGAARKLGLEVTVIERSSAPLAGVFGEDVGSWFRSLHERQGVGLICDTPITAVTKTPAGFTIELLNGSQLHADVVVAGVGAAPAVEWLEGSGIDLSDGIACTPSLRTSVPGVVAAGDIVRWNNPVYGESMRVEHWSNAVEQGRHAAASLLGEDVPFASVPYFWSDQHDTKMRFVGRAAGATDIRVESATEDKLVVAYGRNGVLVGALCVGAPRLIGSYKAAIQNHQPWDGAAQPALARTS